jgi:mannonate dehydratase
MSANVQAWRCTSLFANQNNDKKNKPTMTTELPLRVGAGHFMRLLPERVRFIKQLGIEDVVINGAFCDQPVPGKPLSGAGKWSFEELRQLHSAARAEGLRLIAIENMPIAFYDKVMLGLPGRDEQIEHICHSIRNLGRAEVPLFGYHWMPNGVWRTQMHLPVRGGARARAFDLAQIEPTLTHDREYSETEMWEYYEYFLQAVLPVAKESGVTLCLHPDDPPVEKLGGIPRLFRNFANFKRALETVPSTHHALELCLGCWSEMGEDLLAVIEYFGRRQQIGYVHFRDVCGDATCFHEVFVDEGNFDEYLVLRALHDVGFRGVIVPDHVPHVEHDTEWGYLTQEYTVGGYCGYAYTFGYLKGLLKAISSEA